MRVPGGDEGLRFCREFSEFRGTVGSDIRHIEERIGGLEALIRDGHAHQRDGLEKLHARVSERATARGVEALSVRLDRIEDRIGGLERAKAKVWGALGLVTLAAAVAASLGAFVR